MEQTLSWINRFRRLKVRYERQADVHQAFLDLGCALICWNQVQRFCWAHLMRFEKLSSCSHQVLPNRCSHHQDKTFTSGLQEPQLMYVCFVPPPSPLG